MVNENKSEVLIKVRGRRNDYWRFTIASWLYEIKDILEQEYNTKIKIIEEDEDRTLPAIFIGDTEIGEGIPGEEGYLIEILKKALDKIIGKVHKQV